MEGINMREQRPSYVVFERRAIEDRAASMANGRYMTKDEDFAVITPIGSKDRIPRLVKEWFINLDQQVQEDRLPAAWRDQYKAAYAAWKRGEEVPLSGTPIKGWAVLSPSQQQNILGADIRTVEDLAQANDEAMKRIGMGALELKEKAQAWLKSAGSAGVVAQESAGLKAKNRAQETHILSLTQQIADLKLELETLSSQLASRETSET